jgi:hypothetical protein
MVVIKCEYQPTIKLTDPAFNWLAMHESEQAAVERFVSLMIEELAANDEKGNRPGWLTMTPAEAVAELLYHAGKLSLAVREVGSGKAPDPRTAGFHPADVQEFAADVANCALMVLDCMRPSLLSLSAPEPNHDPVDIACGIGGALEIAASRQHAPGRQPPVTDGGDGR